MWQYQEKFSLKDQVAIITGAAGLLGKEHAEAVLSAGAICVLLDINEERLKTVKDELIEKGYCKEKLLIFMADITKEEQILNVLEKIVEKHGTVDILINNAALNPSMKENTGKEYSRLENYSISMWQKEIDVGLTGAFLCAKVFGSFMAKNAKGVVLNIASDLGVIAPDQRIYKKYDLIEEEQPVKPVTYSVVKAGLIGLTRYLATYWADKNIRVNALVPGGVFDGQNDLFVQKLTNLIPMGRMAKKDEYRAAILFLVSEASSYMTGANLIIDGGRTVW